MNIQNAETKIQQLDLDHVRAYLAEKKKWHPSYAKQVEQDYRDFLKLYAAAPDGEFVSTRDVDDFWHAHILHVSKYINDCVDVFGFVLDHLPVVEEGKDLTPYHDRHQKTQESFAKIFGRSMGNGNDKTAICFSDAPQKNAICFGRAPYVGAICFGRAPTLKI